MNVSKNKAQGGFVLITVIVVTFVMCLLIAICLSYTASEQRMNFRGELMQKADMAAEALTEYGVSQVRYKFSNRSSFNFGSSGSDLLKLPAASFWTGVPIELDTAKADPVELFACAKMTYTTASSALYYIDPADKANVSDPNVGMWVMRTDVPILAKVKLYGAVQGNTRQSPVLSYALQRLSVRAVPLFAHAVFYNMNMEVAPGASMDILGPVHVNGSAYVGPMYSAALNFSDSVTMTGNIYHAWSSSKASAQGKGNESLGSSDSSVNFLAGEGTDMANLYTTYKGKTGWMDSTMAAFNYSATLSIPDTTAADPAFAAFASERWGGKLQTSSHGVMPYNPPAIGTYAADNNASDGKDTSNNSARQIIEPTKYPAAGEADYNAKMEVEKTKYANDAGLYIQVNATNGNITAMSRSKSSPSNTPIATGLTLPAGLVKWNPYSYNTKTKAVTGGIYDQRQGDSKPADGLSSTDITKGVNLVEIDVGKLKAAIDVIGTNNSAAITGLSPSNWTGIVYVEVTGAPTTNVDGTTNAATVAKSLSTGVRLKNGSQLPTYGSDHEGLTVATNVGLYVQGNYNADGNITANSDPTKSSACAATDAGEVPAALVGDAVTILSSNFTDSTSYTAQRPASAATIEISAAILTGMVPTDKEGNGIFSGGLHNFPRFLEHWQGKDVWIRGSMVALFESRVGVKPFSTDYYWAPNRHWGFNSLFKSGRFPPGTPMVFNFRRSEFKSLTAAEYAAWKAKYTSQ